MPAPGVLMPAPGVLMPAPGVLMPAPRVLISAPRVLMPVPPVFMRPPLPGDRLPRARGSGLRARARARSSFLLRTTKLPSPPRRPRSSSPGRRSSPSRSPPSATASRSRACSEPVVARSRRRRSTGVQITDPDVRLVRMLHAGEARHAGIVALLHALVRAAATDDALRRLDRTVAQPLLRNRILFGARIESIHRANAGRDEDRECARGQAPDEHASNVHGCILLSAALRGSGQKARSSGPDGREISKVGERDGCKSRFASDFSSSRSHSHS